MTGAVYAKAGMGVRRSLVCQYAYLVSSSKGGAPAFQQSFSTTRLLPDANRSYADAIKLLDSLQSNRTVVSAISNASSDINKNAIPEMLEWTRRAGYEVEDFAQHGLRCIHVAGTKGKGSVCIMVEKILLQYRKGFGKTHAGEGAGLGKIGLYTSPHLIHVRERIRIDEAPISESTFARYFFEIWDRLSKPPAGVSQSNLTSSDEKPGYFRYLTLMAFHTFISEGVETAIIECGIGGQHDSTNILPVSAVTTTAITRLGIDHVGMLGSTIESIAWHKAGIMKAGIPAFTVVQEPTAQETLTSRAIEIGVDLKTVARLPALDNGEIRLGLDGDFQKDNASLAVAVASSHLKVLAIPHINKSVDFVQALKTSAHDGRCQTIIDGDMTWHLDGAHTLESITEAALWFKSKCVEALVAGTPPTNTILIFAAQGEGRDPPKLLERMLSAPIAEVCDTSPKARRAVRSSFTHACFCTLEVFNGSPPKPGERQKLKKLAIEYEQLVDGSASQIQAASIQEAIETAKQIAEGGDRTFALVTGSLHLVGGVLQVLDLEKNRKMTKRGKEIAA